MKKRIKKAFSDKQIAKRIDKLGATIRKDAGKGEIFLLGVLKGTSFFIADLMRAIPGEVTYGFIDVIRDMADTGPTAMERIGEFRVASFQLAVPEMESLPANRQPRRLRMVAPVAAIDPSQVVPAVSPTPSMTRYDWDGVNETVAARVETPG